MLKRLRIKFVCINMAIVTIMLGIIFGTVLHFTQVTLETQSVQMMHAAALSPNHTNRPDRPPEQMQLPYFVLHLDKSGRRTAAVSSFYDLSDEGLLDELTAIAISSEDPVGVIPEYDLRFCRSGSPWGESIVFADMSTEKNVLSGLLRNCCLIGGASFLLFLLISILLAQWAIRPVEKAWRQQRQFVADASHELKTPLTVITTNAELLQSPDCDEAGREKFSGSILTMSRQMRGLVESLLELARIDNGAARTTFSSLDLSQLVQEAVLPFDAVFFEREMLLECRVHPGIQVRGSQSHLRQVVEILLDNAQKYSAPGARITLSLAPLHRSYCVLQVSNPGVEISGEDQTRIFERFYRADKARSMNHSYGLGLSIAQSIVLDHHGRIWCESAGGINTFFVQLPML